MYVRARPVRKGVDFLSKLGSDLDERMLFRALLAADSFTDDSFNSNPVFSCCKRVFENKLL
jgi:hypothetical protein